MNITTDISPAEAFARWSDFIDELGRHEVLFGLVCFVDFCVAARVARMVRENITSPMHWSRSVPIVAIGTYGGSTIASILVGHPAGYTFQFSAIVGAILAWVLTFFCPFDLWLKFHRLPGVDHAFQVVEALNLAISIGRKGGENALTVHERLTFTAPRPTSLVFVAAAICGCGGGVAVEALNLLLRDQGARQATSRTSADNIVRALVGALFFVAVRLPLPGQARAFLPSGKEAIGALALFLLADHLLGFIRLLSPTTVVQPLPKPKPAPASVSTPASPPPTSSAEKPAKTAAPTATREAQGVEDTKVVKGSKVGGKDDMPKGSEAGSRGPAPSTPTEDGWERVGPKDGAVRRRHKSKSGGH